MKTKPQLLRVGLFGMVRQKELQLDAELGGHDSLELGGRICCQGELAAGDELGCAPVHGVFVRYDVLLVVHIGAQ